MGAHAVLAYTIAAISPNMDVANAALPCYTVTLLFFSGWWPLHQSHPHPQASGVGESSPHSNLVAFLGRSLISGEACDAFWTRSDPEGSLSHLRGHGFWVRRSSAVMNSRLVRIRAVPAGCCSTLLVCENRHRTSFSYAEVSGNNFPSTICGRRHGLSCLCQALLIRWPCGFACPRTPKFGGLFS